MQHNKNYFEIIIGFFVICCAAYFLFNASKSTNINDSTERYNVIAYFDNIDGIYSGTDIKLSGVKIGTVKNVSLDKKTYKAKVILSIDSNINLPNDTSLKVASEGLLGSKFLSINPGADEENLKEGDEISYTQSSVNLEELLGKFIFGNDKKE